MDSIRVEVFINRLFRWMQEKHNQHQPKCYVVKRNYQFLKITPAINTILLSLMYSRVRAFRHLNLHHVRIVVATWTNYCSSKYACEQISGENRTRWQCVLPMNCQCRQYPYYPAFLFSRKPTSVLHVLRISQYFIRFFIQYFILYISTIFYTI